MVDVGYCIDGKHGVIRKVMPISNTKTEHLCFIQADGEEQYALKKEDIEYVIPHEEEHIMIMGDKDGWYESSYTEERMIELCQKVDPPITFAEKFKEVFGYEPNRCYNICDVMNCNYFHDDCQKCPYKDNDWDEPYVKAEVEDDKC